MASNQSAGVATEALDTLLDSSIRQGMDPHELARQVFAGIEAGDFWLLPHKSFKPALQRRLTSILEETNPIFEMVGVEEDNHGA